MKLIENALINTIAFAGTTYYVMEVIPEIQKNGIDWGRTKAYLISYAIIFSFYLIADVMRKRKNNKNRDNENDEE